jgi:2-keto-3-deoxy-L-rhamnonate aldolase RhmA
MTYTIGSWITLAHISIVEVMADAGFDWLCIDIEHSIIDYNDVQLLILAIQSKNIKAFVRVGSNDKLIIKRVLDAGADGIIVPMINTKSEAIKAIEAVKYPPIGKRSVGLARAQKYGFGFDEYKDHIANEIKLIVQIEHVDAINNLEEILSLEHIDGTFIGPYDLSGSVGKPGEFYDNDVIKLLNIYEKVVSNYDKLIGVHVVEPDYLRVLEKINKGYNFIAFSFDNYFLGTIAREQLNKIKI